MQQLDWTFTASLANMGLDNFFWLGILIFIVYQALVFYKEYFMINRNTIDGEVIMKTYIELLKKRNENAK